LSQIQIQIHTQTEIVQVQDKIKALKKIIRDLKKHKMHNDGFRKYCLVCGKTVEEIDKIDS